MQTNTTAPKPKRRRRSNKWTAAAAAVALFAAACGTAEQTAEAAPAESDAPAQDLPTIDAALFSGEVMTLEGGTFDLATLADQDLVLWFWAPW